MSILRTIRRRYSTLGEGVGEGDKGRGSLPIYPSLPSRIRPLPLPFRFVWQNKQTKKKKSYFMSYLQLYFLILSHCLDIKSGFDIGLESWLQIQSVCAHYDDIVSGEINPFVVFTHGWHSQDGKKKMLFWNWRLLQFSFSCCCFVFLGGNYSYFYDQ